MGLVPAGVPVVTSAPAVSGAAANATSRKVTPTASSSGVAVFTGAAGRVDAGAVLGAGVGVVLAGLMACLL